MPLLCDGAADVLDVGCGRGEFLDLLAAAGMPARGLDLQSRDGRDRAARAGSTSPNATAVAISSACPTGRSAASSRSRSSSTCEPGYLLRAPRRRVPQAAARRAASSSRRSTRRAGSRSSPATSATSRTCGRCIPRRCTTSHGQRLHARARGVPLAVSRIRQAAEGRASPRRRQADLADTVNGNTERLNALLFTYMDYAAIGERG